MTYDMSGTMNEPVRLRCDCGELLPEDPVHASEHPGECCDCFDVGWGMRPPVKLVRKTAASWHLYGEYD